MNAMKSRFLSVCLLGLLAGPIACNNSQPTASAPAKPSLNINPYGTSGVKPDMSKVPDDLKKVFDYIDTHTDQDTENLQKWIQQPSISNSGEGIPESAEMVKGFFDKLGCQTTRVYDVGITEYGTPGNPVVYAKCDEGAEDGRHLLAIRHDASYATHELGRSSIRSAYHSRQPDQSAPIF